MPYHRSQGGLLKEALEDGWKDYQQQVITNARAMAGALVTRGIRIVSGGTDDHLFLVDLIGKEYSGKDAEDVWAEPILL